MLVDDDYPVLQLLEEAICWEELGMVITGSLQNGAKALDHAMADMPDILITDIGMPKMAGMELIARLKAIRPNLRTAILSCHSEFHFAKQALKLNVQDYIVKDTFQPEDLETLLRQFKASLDQERLMESRQVQLQQMADRSKSALKGTFIRNVLHQPILEPEQWLTEARSLGLDLEKLNVLPITVHVDKYRSARHRFMSESVLQFALENVMEEILSGGGYPARLFAYNPKQSFILYSYQPSLKINEYDEAERMAAQLQDKVFQTLKLSLSFIIGETGRGVGQLKERLNKLLFSGGQRFYIGAGDISKRSDAAFAEEDLFALYDEAFGQFRDVLVHGADAEDTVAYWTGRIGRRRYPPETVKDWMLKLLLDLKLKVQSLQHFRSLYSVDVLHREVVEIDTLFELRDWLTDYFKAVKPVVGEILTHSRRVEVLDAIGYVARNMEKRISLEEVSRQLHLNASYFSRLFRKETGETFIEYVTRTKMERAKELLDQTSLAVSKICEQLGYDNQSYFIKTFKSHTGVTPLDYRGRKAED
ncbi:helix-turn-helix domain-containing protein [Paenibacillus tarimensis]